MHESWIIVKTGQQKKCLLQPMSMSCCIVSSVTSTGTLGTSIFNSHYFFFTKKYQGPLFWENFLGTHIGWTLSFSLRMRFWSPTNTFNQFENFIHNIFRNENSTLEINVTHFCGAALATVAVLQIHPCYQCCYSGLLLLKP